MSECEHEWLHMNTYISDDENKLKETYECYHCGKRKEVVKYNNWRRQELDELCPVCSHKLVRLMRERKYEKDEHGEWCSKHPYSKEFTGCSNWPNCCYKKPKEKFKWPKGCGPNSGFADDWDSCEDEEGIGGFWGD